MNGYRAPIALMATGVTYRQLDYWARTGLVAPSQPSSESITDYLHGGPVFAIDLAAITREVQAVLDAHESAQEAA